MSTQVTTRTLRDVRNGLGYSQKDFAKIAGVHQTAVSHIELDRRKMSTAYAQALETISGGLYKWPDFFIGGASAVASYYDWSESEQGKCSNGEDKGECGKHSND